MKRTYSVIYAPMLPGWMINNPPTPLWKGKIIHKDATENEREILKRKLPWFDVIEI